MSLILDVIVIAIVVLFVITSAKRGFVNILVEVVGFIAAIFLTFTISTPLAGTTYDKIIEPPIVSAVSEEGASNASQVVTDVWEALPSFATAAAENAGVSSQKLNESISANIQNGAENAVKAASQNLIRPAVVKILGLIYSVVLLIILFFAVKLVARLVNRLFSFSFVGKANRTLGGIIGIFKGIIFAVFFCLVISLIVSFTDNGFLIFTPENINNSHIFKLFTEINYTV